MGDGREVGDLVSFVCKMIKESCGLLCTQEESVMCD